MIELTFLLIALVVLVVGAVAYVTLKGNTESEIAVADAERMLERLKTGDLSSYKKPSSYIRQYRAGFKRRPSSVQKELANLAMA